jgi:hypothetical protein
MLIEIIVCAYNKQQGTLDASNQLYKIARKTLYMESENKFVHENVSNIMNRAHLITSNHPRAHLITSNHPREHLGRVTLEHTLLHLVTHNYIYDSERSIPYYIS